MNCDECKSMKATVHYTNIVNGNKSEKHLCKECAKKLESMGGFKFVNEDSFLPFMSFVGQSITAKACPTCGTRLNDFNSSGFLGCPQCYLEFQQELLPIIKRVQGSIKHIGKAPKGSDFASVNEFDRITAELKKAVDDERYEEAAALRDKLKKFR